MPLDEYDCGNYISYDRRMDIYNVNTIDGKLIEFFSYEIENNESTQHIMKEMEIKIQQARILLKSLEHRHITSIGLRFYHYKPDKSSWYHVTVWR